MFARLYSSPVHYDWGVINAFSNLVGTRESDKPEAELWFGAHPSSKTFIIEGPGTTTFQEWLSRSGTDFPILVKLLAIAKPLSIQVHPNSEIARKGFDQQEGAGLEQGDGRAIFSDPFAKPELLIALSDRVRVMWGLLPPEKFCSRIDSLVDMGFDARPSSEWKELFSESPRVFVEQVLRNTKWARETTKLLVDWADRHGEALGEDDWHPLTLVRALNAEHPGDPGILLALGMHWLTLQRGEGIYVHPGDVHCYIEGLGLEIMAPSDNVARAGLTSKRIDVDVFMDWSSLMPSEKPQILSAGEQYSGFPAPFRVQQLSTSSSVVLDTESIQYCESGTFTATVNGFGVVLEAGTISFCDTQAEIDYDGTGSLWIISGSRN